MNKIYLTTDYRKIMRDQLTGPEKRGQLTKAALALHCQKSLLSRVMKSEIHITLDQAFGLCEFWHFDSEQREYFMTTVEYARSGEKKYREHLLMKIKTIQKKQEDVGKRINRSGLDLYPTESQYFSNWLWSAIHIMVSIPRFQDLNALSEALGVPKSLVQEILEKMVERKMVERKGSKWIYFGGEFHISKNSPFIHSHHQNWRWRAVADSQLVRDDSVHFTAVQSLSLADYEKVRRLLLDCIEDISKIARSSPPEECLAINIDQFRPYF